MISQAAIITIVTTTLVTALVTFFVTTVSGRRSYESYIREVVESHVKANHSVDVGSLIDTKLMRHENTCDGHRRIRRIESAVIFLVVKSGGTLEEAGLDDSA
jgi:hypothetical protein